MIFVVTIMNIKMHECVFSYKKKLSMHSNLSGNLCKPNTGRPVLIIITIILPIKFFAVRFDFALQF